MKVIPLTQNKVAWVDDRDYERVMIHKWCLAKRGRLNYAASRIDGKLTMLHRFILNPPSGYDTDHIDGNGLDDRRENLRNCTRQENSRNQQPQLNCSSRYKGVYLNNQKTKWCAEIKVDGKYEHLGSFDNEDDAALAYNRAASLRFGKFARLNDIVRPGKTYSMFG